MVIKTSDLSYKGLTCHGTIKSESKNLFEKLRGNNIFKNVQHENNFKVENVGCKNSVNWNHIESILYWNQEYSNSIHIDPNHTDSNQLNADNSTNIGSIHDSDHICAIEKILASPVHSLIHTSSMFTCGSSSDPQSSPHDSSAESVTPKVNPKPHYKLPNKVLYVPDDSYLEPSLSYYSLPDPSNSSDDEYYKQRQRAKKDKINPGVKRVLMTQ